MISLAVAAAGWVGGCSPGDYAAFKFPPTPRHDLNHLLRFDFPTFTRNEGNPNEPDKTEWAIFQKTGIAGLRYHQDLSERMHGGKARRADFSSGKSLRHAEMNRRVMRAIKRLNKAWGADWDR